MVLDLITDDVDSELSDTIILHMFLHSCVFSSQVLIVEDGRRKTHFSYVCCSNEIQTVDDYWADLDRARVMRCMWSTRFQMSHGSLSQWMGRWALDGHQFIACSMYR